jgi:hypothetical protein
MGKSLQIIAKLIREGYIKSQVTSVLPLAVAKKAQEVSEFYKGEDCVVSR